MKRNNKFSKKELKVEEWIKRAEDDELNAQSILKHKDGTPNAVCFLSHQMAEKYLKTVLIAKKNWFPKIHPLDKLLEFCLEIDQSFKAIKNEIFFLNPFYVQTRYPGDYPEFSWKDAKEAFGAATRVKKFVLKKLKWPH